MGAADTPAATPDTPPETPASRPAVTRRRLLGALGAGALGLLLARRRGDSPRPPAAGNDDLDAAPLDLVARARRAVERLPLRVGALDDDPLSLATARAFVPFLAGRLPDYVLRFASPDEGLPQVAVAASDPGADYQRQRVIRPFVPVTNWRLPLHAIAPEELAGIFAGRLTDWSQLGSPVPGAIARLDFTPAAPPAIPGVATPIAPVAACADYEALVAGLDAHPTGIALVPLDAVDFRVQTLALDERNLDPLAGRGDLAAYPLRRELWLNWEPRLGSALRDAANTFALQQGYLPDGGPAPAPVVNLTVAGDIIFGRTVHRRMVEYGDFAHPLRGVAPRLAAADLTIADLECSLSDRTEKPESPTTFFFTTNAAAVDGLILAGIDGVSLANNHSMNFGALGLTDTLAVLEGAGITPFGGGLDLAASRRPGLFEVKGTTIAWLGYDGISAAEYGAGPDWPGTCPLDADLVVEDIAAAKAAGADLVIPFFHWSEEYVAVPSAFMREMAHLAIDSGAGLVVGSHPHWVQGTEWYKGVPILYSLGNFVFDQEWSLETKQGMFAEIVLRGGRPVRLRLVPVLIEDYNRPRILSLAEGLPILERVYEATDR